jgi:hypothetical protein
MGEIWVFTSIGRGASREEGREDPILLDEWQDVVDADPSLEYIETLPLASDPVTGTILRRPARWSARWTAHPTHLPVAFHWRRDHLDVVLDDAENVIGELDGPTQAKAEGIAAALGARVHVERVDWSEEEGEEADP